MNQIKELRKKQGISQQKLADLIGVSDASINKYEKGLMKPKIDKQAKMSEVFGVPISYLLNCFGSSVSIDIDKSNNQERHTLPLAEYKRLKAIEEKYNAIKKITSKE